ncbi:hypothetical protein PPTG_22857 [Phytophthora nicotianae INRA-310]|uniref:Neutral zinc metallopeptidase n=1 Tax=Phytophthora nicotianae (strain INRA-310) TaxID=761204 RepID=W2QBK4_PHYN3|nr:hypothetical protein PPTG_22857 [Phytophthora nicotianae INRA-310]ETN09924.1 hypothetical protein PPTG_22857 [Phytophthora nicotianae INRA-310]
MPLNQMGTDSSVQQDTSIKATALLMWLDDALQRGLLDSPASDLPASLDRSNLVAILDFSTMASSKNIPNFSTKHLLVAALAASAACSVQAAGSNSSTSGDHATFGDITSGSGKCVTGNPNKGGVTRNQVDWVWENTMSKYIPDFKNLIFDQLAASNGKLSYCVRWDNEKPLTKATASKFQAVLEKQINHWNRWLGILDGEGSPKCPDECYKHGRGDKSGCKGKPFDLTLWPSTSAGENAFGTGGDWGQRIEVNHFLEYLDKEQQMTLLHEIGHGFGLPEMYLDENKPSGFPTCVMDEDAVLTDADGWLLRSILENIKSRYNF